MNTCQICHNCLNDNNDVINDDNIIIKYGDSRYFIHKRCYNLNNKCIYSESSINSFYEQQISYMIIDNFLYTLVKFVNIKLPNTKSNIFFFCTLFAIFLLLFMYLLFLLVTIIFDISL